MPSEKPGSGPRQRRAELGWVVYPLLVVAALLLLAGVALLASAHRPAPLEQSRQEVAQLDTQVAALAGETRHLEARFREPDPNEIYVVVDTKANRLYLYRGSQLLLEAVASTGSGKKLPMPDGTGEWDFASPLGARRVLTKVKDPIWNKPDWAYLEEDLPVPPKDDPARKVEGHLGAFALDLGEQVKIHGTLEKSLLGQAVSHGCVRLGDEDLKAVYEATPVGARVFFY